MTYLSLFTGAMGGDLAMQHLLGWRCLGYVEIDSYCQRLIRQRQDDGLIDRAPIFGDIKTFISEGYADSYQGMVDCVTGGFPCQPFSVAGKRRGEADERNMWPATIATIRAVRPRYCFMENVPGLIPSGYFGRIIGDLHESGFDARWRILSAAEVGAPHKRDRLWILADANRPVQGWRDEPQRRSYRRDAVVTWNGAEGVVADTTGERAVSTQQPGLGCSPEQSGAAMADAPSLQPRAGQQPTGDNEAGYRSARDVSDADQSRLEGRQRGELSKCSCERFAGEGSASMADAALELPHGTGASRPAGWREFTNVRWWETEPDVGGTSNGFSYGMDVI